MFKKKKPNVSNLVKKTDYNIKINEIEKKKLLIMIMINILLLSLVFLMEQNILLYKYLKISIYTS